MKPGALVLGLVCAVSLAGCASAATGQRASSADDTPSVVSASAAATATPGSTSSSGRPSTAFDPCSDLSPDVLAKMGYDPNYKDAANSTFQGGSYAFRTCGFRSPDYSLRIASGDRTVDEQHDGPRPGDVEEPTNITGRKGYIVRNPSFQLTCSLFFSTSEGEVLMTRTQGEKPQDLGLDVCDDIKKTATVLASALPKGV
ncbi:DUF3558 domain-containing protein [Speluncibacter jeojiensis]|uniref:DUF3558 domain-containing protein n=1 Tax=Speluncibacter jeojiensis TaxID=2710754 RepID=A0A9X4RDH4_9ACTN|nr:DUF3558 domain-containing protein [Corynebacteriales bacterium D3-21]